MKVTFVAPYYLPLSIGGFQSQVYQIFKELKKLEVDALWYSFENDSLDGIDILQVMSVDSSMIPVMQRARNRGIKVVLTPMTGSRLNSNAYLKATLLLSKIPQVCSMPKLTRIAIHCADYLTPLCKYEAKRLTSVYGFNNDKIRIIPNGVDDAYFSEKQKKVPIPFEGYLLIVGRIEKNKNQLALIEIAKELDVNLVIVGEPGDDGDSYMQKCIDKASDKVLFWGVEKDPYVLKELFRHATLTVIPSYSEMVPLVAFESLSQKTPVVCTNRCGISEDQIAGLIFSNINKHSLRKSIQIGFEINRDSITYEGVYTWSDIAKQYKSVYEQLLDSKL